jgi:DNA-binding PadR family transcriptional regulator
MGRGPGFAAIRVLGAIAAGAAYGFDIIDATGLPSGTVYPALSRLEQDGYLRSSWEDPVDAHREKRPPRRYYKLTAEGKRAMDRALESIGAPSRFRTSRAKGRP